MTTRSMATAVAAVLGIAVSAALAWAASQLSGQRVGLASEPLSVATGLSPPTRSTPAHAAPRRADDHPITRRTQPAARPRASSTTATTAPPPSPPGTVTRAPAAPATAAPATTTATAAHTTTASGGAFAPAAGAGARRPGHHGDGGDQHDD
ncbi:MAG: hypothetical protein ACXVSE_15740 [Solirubrobacteraceae bacterium]